MTARLIDRGGGGFCEAALNLYYTSAVEVEDLPISSTNRCVTIYDMRRDAWYIIGVGDEISGRDACMHACIICILYSMTLAILAMCMDI